MGEPICMRLPFLGPGLSGRRNGESAVIIRNARYLWPGLPAESMDTGRYWKPQNYPFDERTAEACVRDLAQMGIADLESMRLLLNGSNAESDAGKFVEMAEISGFASGEETKTPERLKTRLALEQAQKILFWVWIQEKRLCEIAELESRYASMNMSLSDNFKESGAGIAEGKGTRETEPEARGKDPDFSLLPSWRIRTFNAALFIPVDIPLFIEGGMADDLWETLEFLPAPALAQTLGVEGNGALYAARASLWKATGSRGAWAGDDLLGALRNGERKWLVWRTND